MPIYLVRWPGFHVSLVRARNEDELVDLLDDVADPGGCRWTVYRGPLWIDLDPPLKIEDKSATGELRNDADVNVVGVDAIDADGLTYTASIGGEETFGEMSNA